MLFGAITPPSTTKTTTKITTTTTTTTTTNGRSSTRTTTSSGKGFSTVKFTGDGSTTVNKDGVTAKATGVVAFTHGVKAGPQVSAGNSYKAGDVTGKSDTEVKTNDLELIEQKLAETKQDCSTQFDTKISEYLEAKGLGDEAKETLLAVVQGDFKSTLTEMLDDCFDELKTQTGNLEELIKKKQEEESNQLLEDAISGAKEKIDQLITEQQGAAAITIQKIVRGNKLRQTLKIQTKTKLEYALRRLDNLCIGDKLGGNSDPSTAVERGVLNKVAKTLCLKTQEGPDVELTAEKGSFMRGIDSLRGHSPINSFIEKSGSEFKKNKIV